MEKYQEVRRPRRNINQAVVTIVGAASRCTRHVLVSACLRDEAS